MTLVQLDAMSKQLLNQMPVGVVAACPNTYQLAYANPFFCQMVGYTEADILKLHVQDLHHDEDLSAVQAAFTEMLAGDSDTPAQFAVLRHDGSSFIARIQAFLLPSEHSPWLVAVFHDVSDLMLVQQRLADRSAKLQLAIQASGQSLFDMDIESQQLTLYQAEHDEVGKLLSFSRFLAQIHPDDQPTVRNLLQNTVSPQVGMLTCEYRMRDSAGQWRWQQVFGKVTALTADGAIRHVVGLQLDIQQTRHLERQLSQERSFLKTLLANIPDLVWLKDVDGAYLACNRRFEQLYGCTEDELLGKHDDDFVGAEEARSFRLHDRLALAAEGKVVNEEWLTFKADNHTELVETSKVRLTAEDGHVLGVLGIAHDVTERHHYVEQLRLAASVFDSALEGIMITSPDGTIVDVNQSFSRITGYSREQAIGQNAHMLSSGRHSPSFYQALWYQLTTEGYWSGEIWNRRANGDIYVELLHISSVKDSQQQLKNFVAVFSDITTLKTQQQQLELIAHFDVLTGLPNRVLLVDRLRQAIQQSQRSKKNLAVVFIDLDGFKAINDGYGHATGDLVLTQIAQRFKEALRGGDTIARIGGDEFIAILPELTDAKATMPILERILDAASRVIKIDQTELHVSASIGITFAPQAKDLDADLLIRQADQAMYQAKLAGKNRFHVFDPRKDFTVRSQFELLNEVRHGIQKEQFELYYQPRVQLCTGQLLGFEALIRWHHPSRGFLLPSAFIPAVIQHPLAIELGDWVIQKALSQLRKWQQKGLKTCISVNVDSQQLNDFDFRRRLQTQFQNYPELQPNQLELEVLETSTLENLPFVHELIVSLQNEGFQFALDDFGTGYSSLTFLKQLPARILKIDQSFIRQMLHDAEQLVIIESVLHLAQRFHRVVVAEGVENWLHGALLIGLGCQEAQGFRIAKPMPAREVFRWLESWQLPPCWQAVSKLEKCAVDGLIALIDALECLSAAAQGFNDRTMLHLPAWCQRSDVIERYQHHPAYAPLLSLLKQSTQDMESELLYWTLQLLFAEPAQIEAWRQDFQPIFEEMEIAVPSKEKRPLRH